jgi:aspartate/methionine/tyrosine aminotransferase
VHEALQRLELVCDTYLSVSTPVQLAAPGLLERGRSVREAIAARVGANYRALRDAAAPWPACRVLPADGGWYGVLQVPATVDEETRVLGLLERDRVLVHPGYFFDFPREAFLVVSLLPPPDAFAPAVATVLARCDS